MKPTARLLRLEANQHKPYQPSMPTARATQNPWTFDATFLGGSERDAHPGGVAG